MSLALEICRLAEEEVGAGSLGRVREVGVEVGDEAGVVVENLEFCLEALLDRPPFGRARPVIERKAGRVLRLSWLEVEDGRTEAA